MHGERRHISVLLVEGHQLTLEALAACLGQELDLEVVLSVRTAAEAIMVASAITPDVIVFDIELRAKGSFDAAKAIRVAQPDCRIVILSAHIQDHFVRQAIEAGATAYVTKQESVHALANAIREVAAGRTVYPESVRDRLAAVKAGGSRSTQAYPFGKLLTVREFEIAGYVAQGLSDRKIANVAQISTKTVEAHCANIRNKLCVRSRVGIACFAFRQGLISL